MPIRESRRSASKPTWLPLLGLLAACSAELSGGAAMDETERLIAVLEAQFAKGTARLRGVARVR